MSLTVQCHGDVYEGRCEECGAQTWTGHTRTLATLEEAFALGYINAKPHPPMPTILGCAAVHEPGQGHGGDERWLYETPIGRVYVFPHHDDGYSSASFLLGTDASAGWVDVGRSKGSPSEAAKRADRWLSVLQVAIARGATCSK